MEQRSLTEHMQNSTIQLLLSLGSDEKCKYRVETISVLFFVAFHFKAHCLRKTFALKDCGMLKGNMAPQFEEQKRKFR